MVLRAEIKLHVYDDPVYAFARREYLALHWPFGPGAYADLLLVDGNPLEDLGAVTDVNNLKIIMKDGKIYKNTLD